jgi:hypothetical protein
VKRTKKPLKELKKENYGIHEHRLKDNPMEAQALLSFQKLNASTAGPMNNRDVVDTLVHHAHVEAYATSGQRRDVCTVIQWLGSPVGFAWLVDTFGLEVTRAMRGRVEHDSAIQLGQVYRSLDHRDVKVGRTVTVERLRYGVNTVGYRTGAHTPWAVRSSTTGRLSYVYERRLLDKTQFELVP